MCGTCVPCCLIKRNADDLGMIGWHFCLLSCLCPFIPIFILRQVARERYGIEGSPVEDAMCSCCCGALVNCQTGSEVKKQGDRGYVTARIYMY